MHETVKYLLLPEFREATARLPHGVCCHAEQFVHTHYLPSLALIFFEYTLTFDQEVRLFWGKKLTGAVSLFFANRYATVIYTIYYTLIMVVPAAAATAQVGFRLFYCESVSNVYLLH